MKKRQTKKKQNKREINFKKKAKQGEEWWGTVNFREKGVKSKKQGERSDRR